jgi:hypothetical protein
MIHENLDNDKEITRQMLSHWVAESVGLVSIETITNTFNKIGFYGITLHKQKLHFVPLRLISHINLWILSKSLQLEPVYLHILF